MSREDYVQTILELARLARVSVVVAEPQKPGSVTVANEGVGIELRSSSERHAELTIRWPPRPRPRLVDPLDGEA
jgi:hypothetical protein